MDTAFSDLLRVDPLTGCKNYLGFLETLTHHSLSDTPADGRSRETLDHFRINASEYSAVLFVAMNDMRVLNAAKGRVYGDSAIRWMGILLREECSREVYRVGGIEFAVLLNLEAREAHADLTERILERMEREASSFGFPDSAAEIALVLFDRSPTSLDTILLKMGEAMVRVKTEPGVPFMAFEASDFQVHAQPPERWWGQSGDGDVPFAVRWISIINILQVLEMGKILDEARQEAYTDAISGLPNMKAALLRIEETRQDSNANHKSFSILMIDGDNIRIYNSVNYAAGDEMIRQMSVLFKDNLRPEDFIARWRSGDEFLAVLPDTPLEGAAKIAERFRLAVKQTSKSWRFPVTISIGVASYPTHGVNIDALVDRVEGANKRAKEQGKDRVVLAD